jgi:hypothetical protein
MPFDHNVAVSDIVLIVKEIVRIDRADEGFNVFALFVPFRTEIDNIGLNHFVVHAPVLPATKPRSSRRGQDRQDRALAS